MDKIKTDGVEYTSDGGHGNGQQSNVWGGAVGGFVGGGILGYLLGQGVNGGCNRRNGNCGNCGNCGGCNNCGCSESQFVNRFELEQSERAEKLEAELAKEKAERYADSIGIATFEKVVAYFDKQMERRDNLAAELTKAVALLDKNEAVNGQKLDCLRDKVAEATDAIAALSKGTAKAIAESKAEIENWANCRFIAQPRLKLCCGTPSWECGDSDGGTTM